MSAISHRLQEFRAKHDKSQKEMAEMLGIPFRTLQDCERGKTLPSATTLIAYSDLGANLNWIVRGEQLKTEETTNQAGECNTDHWWEDFEPIAWFASEDIRDSYIVFDDERRRTAKIALHNSEIAKLTDGTPAPSEFASTTIQACNAQSSEEKLILFRITETTVLEEPADYLISDEKLRLATLQRLDNGNIIEIAGLHNLAIKLRSEDIKVVGQVLELSQH